MAYYTRSRAANEYKSAGVLPFALSGDQILVLLGAEKTRTGPKGKVWKYLWRDFGGGREAADTDSAATAAREFAEETLGLYGGCSVDQSSVDACAVALAQRLRDPSKALKVVHVLKKGKYDMYMTQISLIEPLIFRLATQQNQATGAVPGGEKSAFAWVPLAELLQAVGTPRRRYPLTCRSSVCGGLGTPPPCGRGCRQFALHPCFANSLRLAQGGGLQELLARSETLPLPAPPPAAPSGFAPVAAAATGAAAAAAAKPGQRPGEREAAASGMDDDGEGEGEGDIGGGSSSPSGSAASQGPTPEHMCYWLAVEGIAMQLRGEDSGAALGAAAGGAAAALAPAPPPPPPPPLQPLAGADSGAGADPGCAPAAAVPGQGPLPAATPADSHTSSARSQQQAAAIAAAVAAAAAQPGGEGMGASGRRRRSRKQRQQQRQRRRRQQQQAQEQQQQQRVREEAQLQGPTAPSHSQQQQRWQGAVGEPAHSQQQYHFPHQQQQEQQHSAHDTADSASCQQGGSSELHVGAAAAGQHFVEHGQGQSQGQHGQHGQHGPSSSAPLQGSSPSHFSSYWAAAQDGLTRLLAPHASPRKRVRLE